MAITWGPYVADGSNAFRVGYEFSQSPSSVSSSTSSVTVTVKIYLQTKYYAWDSSVNWVISGSISDSGTNDFNHTSGTAWSSSNITLMATRSRTVTTSYNSPVTTSITASINGLSAIAGTAKVSGSWTTAKRPHVPPAEPTGFTATRISDTQINLTWNNTNPTSASAPYHDLHISRYLWPSGPYVLLDNNTGVIESWSLTNAQANNKYSFRLAATNDAGGSSYIYAGPVATTPATPTSVDAEAVGNDILISWVNNAPHADQFEVWHRTNGVRDGSPIATVGASIRSWTHTAPSTTQNHSYEIRAKVTDVVNPINSAYSTPSVGIQLNDDPPSTPTSVTPATGTVTRPNPTLGGTMAAIATGQTQRMQWQFATNTGFSSNVVTITESTADLRLSGATTESPSLSQLMLSNGTWYMRARAVDKNGLTSGWSATATLTVNTPAPPTPTTVTPANGSSVTTMTPTLGATVVADSAASRTQRVEWQLATNTGFSTNLRTLTEGTADLRASGATTEPLPEGSKITGNGTWYLRARTIAQDGMTSAWSTTQSFTLAMAAPPTPTSVTPAPQATVTTNTPILGAILGAATEGRLVKAEWQLATDSGFTANLRTITEPAADLRLSGSTTEVVPEGSKLSQTTWYVRARSVDEYGQAGAWSAGQSFTVAHQPTATGTAPAADSTLAYVGNVVYAWTFSDPSAGDVQTAYQIIVERNDTGAVLIDTGKVTSSLKTHSAAVASHLKDVKMRWKVRVWDTDNVAGNYSPYRILTLSDLPVVTITAPADAAVIATGQPTFTWTTDGQTVQGTFRVRVTRTSDSAQIFDSGTISSTVQTYTPPNTILENLGSYSVAIEVTDTQGLVGSDTNTFTTSYEVPDTVIYSVDPDQYEDLGYIIIDWSSMQPDGFFVQWNVLRKRPDESEWTLIAEYPNSSITYHRDWLATTGEQWEYAVTQSAGRSGEILDSPPNGTPDTVTAGGTHYWLINPFDESVNVRLDSVKSDSYTDQYEEAELIIIGRGRKKNIGTRYGYEGSLVAQLRDSFGGETARVKRQRLQAIKEAGIVGGVYYLRTPFGDLFQVSIGNLQIDRIAGVGVSEYVDVTIPYSEVF